MVVSLWHKYGYERWTPIGRTANSLRKKGSELGRFEASDLFQSVPLLLPEITCQLPSKRWQWIVLTTNGRTLAEPGDFLRHNLTESQGLESLSVGYGDLPVDEPAAGSIQIEASEKTHAVERSNGVNRLDLTTLQVDNQVVEHYQSEQSAATRLLGSHQQRKDSDQDADES